MFQQLTHNLLFRAPKLIAALLLMATPAQAQSVCAPVDKMLSGLRDGTFKEVPAGAGIVNNVMARLFVNGKTGTWTLLLIRPDGIACITMAGDGWQWPEPEKPGKEL